MDVCVWNRVLYIVPQSISPDIYLTKFVKQLVMGKNKMNKVHLCVSFHFPCLFKYKF